MRALQITTLGVAPTLRDIEKPSPKQGEIGVRIQACGLNFADLLMIKGEYQATPQPPFTLGLEVAGVVEALGAGVADLRVGDRIAVFGGQGGLAEFGCFARELCTKIPDSMSFEDAAAFQVAYGTSHLALTQRANLQAGQTLVVLGAAGGVGLTAVEIGAALGARVIGLARGAEKCAIAAAAGAELTFDTETTDIKAELRALGGADVIYDPLGGTFGEAALAAANVGAHFLAIGFASGSLPDLRPNRLLVKNITVHGFYWGGYLHFAPAALKTSMEDLFAMYTADGLHPHIGHTAELAEALDALEKLRRRETTGKVVITVDHSLA